MELTKSIFFEKYSITLYDLEAYLNEALSRGGDYADLYFEYRVNHSIVLEEQIIKSATKGVGLGVGEQRLLGRQSVPQVRLGGAVVGPVPRTQERRDGDGQQDADDQDDDHDLHQREATTKRLEILEGHCYYLIRARLPTFFLSAVTLGLDVLMISV